MKYITKGGQEHKTLCSALKENKKHDFYIFAVEGDKWSVVNFPCKCFCGNCIQVTKSKLEYHVARQERIAARDELVSRIKATQDKIRLYTSVLGVIL